MTTSFEKITAVACILLVILSSTPRFTVTVFAAEEINSAADHIEPESSDTKASADETEAAGTSEITTSPDTLPEDSFLDESNDSSFDAPGMSSTSLSALPATTTLSATTTSIITGDAVAAANILNVVNTTSVNSHGEVIFGQLTNDQVTDLDFRPQSSSSLECNLVTCLSSAGVAIGAENTTTIDNHIFLEAITGNNELETNLDNAMITTGDAFTGLNLVTIANSTFVDSEYLVVSINAFRDVLGNIIFPGLTNFFTAAVSTAPTSVNLNNQATITSSIETNANTGTNTTLGQHNSIATGDAKSVIQNINSINSALVGGDSILIMLKVHGAWLGEIQGLIPGIEIEIGDDGSYYLRNKNQSTGGGSGSSVSATNTATIHTTARLAANTGNNHISSSEDSLITTGDAYVGANVVNVANATVIGRNWTLAIINIFGDFTGNLAFGRPDLWIGEEISTPGIITNGSVVTYTYTILNQGDAPASALRVKDTFDTDHLTLGKATLPYTIASDGAIEWVLPHTLAVGESMEISYQATVKNVEPGTAMTNTVSVMGHENDNNIIDNSDTGTIYATEIARRGGGSKPKTIAAVGAAGKSTDSVTTEAITVKRTAQVKNGENDDGVVPQEIVISNPTGQSFSNISITDYLRAPNGDIIQTEAWDIGTLLPHEEVTVQYDIIFASNAATGTYSLSANFEQNGITSRSGLALGRIVYAAPIVTSEPVPLELITPNYLAPAPIVLGATTTTVYEPDYPGFTLGSKIAYADSGTDFVVAEPTTFGQPFMALLALLALYGVLIIIRIRQLV